MDISQLQLTPSLSSTGDPQATKSSKIATAAKQFEALLINEMIKSVREASDDGWLGGGTDSSAESAFGIAESQFAQTIADKGGLGLAKTIRHALDNDKSAPPAAPPSR